MRLETVEAAPARRNFEQGWGVEDATSDHLRNDDRGTIRSLELARHYLRQRRLRRDALGGDLLREPAWDIMLDLFCAKLTGREVSIMEASVAGGVPSTTGFRYVRRLLASKVVTECRDAKDRRRSWVELSEEATRQVEAWLHASWPAGI
jgi:DNA-binding MarR family transcriptional regulator